MRALLPLLLAACEPAVPTTPPPAVQAAGGPSAEPPLNAPTRPRAAPPTPPKNPQPLQAGDLRLLVEGRPLVGDLEVSGEVVVEPSAISVVPSAGPPVEIQTLLPEPLGSLVASSAPGKMLLRDRSGPEGADRLVIVGRGGPPLLAEVWIAAAEPINLDLGGGVRLEQVARGVDPRPGMIDVPLELVVNGRRVSLAIGQATPIKGTGLTSWAEISLVQSAPEGEDGGGVRWIVRAWVVGAGVASGGVR